MRRHLTALVAGLIAVAGCRPSSSAERSRRVEFWTVAGARADTAYDWFRAHPEWIVDDTSPALGGGAPGPQRAGYAGPFLLTVPKLGRQVRLYARADAIAASQEAFLREFGH
jgi:hypothetical protein